MSNKDVSRILNIPLDVTVVIGRCKLTLKELLSLRKGSLIDLNCAKDQDVELSVSGNVIAYGKLVLIDQNFGVRITKILNESELMNNII